MNYRWSFDKRYVADLDLEVLHKSGDWHIIAFIRHYPADLSNAPYKCYFMDMLDGPFPNGQTFKTKRGAKNFCERHLPAMWIMHNAKTGGDK